MCNIQCNRTDCEFHYMDDLCSYGGESVIITDKGCMSYEPKHDVRCTKCGWEGSENSLFYNMMSGTFEEYPAWVCPNCLTDEYLIDIE